MKITEEDAGTYQCRASNRDDSLDASSRIEVQVCTFCLSNEC